ncbi:hypothetical protein [Xanthomonas translucens]|nr:hypothetical protein [Xanthomonas translucens]
MEPGLGTRDSGLGTRDSGLGTRDSGFSQVRRMCAFLLEGLQS